ncbi:hypothetical protein [Deinococcus alpinitundrae]|uniref:hypothetical protein n=1 Tax=Deinococcus alpinitundrae TaxID=468913 RepID=UPI00137A789D|nr:hypothetical protein [Deinococcus alpinitundrae]
MTKLLGITLSSISRLLSEPPLFSVWWMVEHCRVGLAAFLEGSVARRPSGPVTTEHPPPCSGYTASQP